MTVLPPPVTTFIVPYINVVHNRAAIEIMRGCTRGCRFCQAGMIFRPVRERPVDEVLQAVDEMIANCGFEEVSFLSLSSSDYTYVAELVRRTMEKHGAKRLSVGLPSLRIESFSVDLMDLLEKGRRRSGFTFAPEAATDRLRDVINKPIASADLLATAEEVYKRRLDHDQDVLHDRPPHADTGRRTGHRRPGPRSAGRRPPRARQEGQRTHWRQHARAQAAHALSVGADGGRRRHPRPDRTAAAFAARPGHPLLVERPAKKRWSRPSSPAATGAWATSSSAPGSWVPSSKAGASTSTFQRGSRPSPIWAWTWIWYARRARPLDEVLPWEHISAGVKKQFLAQEYVHTYQGGVVDDCREHCFSCGILGHFKEQRREAPDEAWECPPLGRGKARQPVNAMPVPLYFNDDMSPERTGQFDHRVPQRREGTVSKRLQPIELVQD